MATASPAKPPRACGGCGEPIAGGGVVRALGAYFHPEHFKCAACKRVLTTSYFEHDGKVFCHDDYVARVRVPRPLSPPPPTDAGAARAQVPQVRAAAAGCAPRPPSKHPPPAHAP